MAPLVVDIRPSQRLVKLIASVERCSGEWDRVSLNRLLSSGEAQHKALKDGARAILDLEYGPRIWSRKDPGGESPISTEMGLQLKSLERAHQAAVGITRTGIKSLYGILIREDPGHSQLLVYRDEPSRGSLVVADSNASFSTSLFPTVAPYLVQQRLEELLDWLERSKNELHPLICAPVFQLLFLQISPYPKLNHSLSLILAWRLLHDHGLPFVRFQHFAPQLTERTAAYHAALRQAEKSCLGTWSTLNAWLEFFADTVLTGARALIERSSKNLGIQLAGTSQRRLVETLREHGALSRESLSKLTAMKIPTVKYNLSALHQKGIIAREGRGRATVYRLVY